jgi:hypothetical protein
MFNKPHRNFIKEAMGACDHCGSAWNECECDERANSFGDERQGDLCPDCNAPPDQPHDLGCPNAPSRNPNDYEPSGVDESDGEDDVTDHRFKNENISFDKYMDNILVSEGYNRPIVKQEDTPQRKRAARNQDRPGNRTRYGVK